MTKNKSPWEPGRGQESLRGVVEKFESRGVTMPTVPKKLMPNIRCGVGNWMMFITDTQLSPFLTYSLGYLSLHDDLRHDFHEMKEDFMICGVNGHGVNSYAFGLIARVGRVLVAQQTGFGGAYNDSGQDRITVNSQMSAWNELLISLEDKAEVDGPDYFVEFSDFSDIAKLWRRLDDATPDRSPYANPFAWQQNWQLVVDLHSRDAVSKFHTDGACCQDEIEIMALSHLVELARSHEGLARSVEVFERHLNREPVMDSKVKPQRVHLVKPPKSLKEMTPEERRDWANALHAKIVESIERKNRRPEA